MPNISEVSDEQLNELVADFKADHDFDTEIDPETAENIKKEVEKLQSSTSKTEEQPSSETSSLSGTYQLPIRNGKILSTFVTPEQVKDKPSAVASTLKHPHGHEAIDVIVSGYDTKTNPGLGEPIYPIGPGKVIKVTSEGGINKKGGNTCTIEHSTDKGLISYYAHLLKVNVSVGEEVTTNTVIGLNGTTGSAKGLAPHVHLETKLNGKKVNPLSDVIGREFGSLTKKASLIRNIYKIACLFEKMVKNK